MTNPKPSPKECCAELLHISDAEFRKLPRSVRMLMLAYSKPTPSGQDGVTVLEIYAYRWPEIDSEIKSAEGRTRTAQGLGKLGRFQRTVRYANDYECEEDGAAWSRLGCASARKERCPVCRRKVKPIAVERYVVGEWVPALPTVWSIIVNWFRSRIQRNGQEQAKWCKSQHKSKIVQN